MVGFSTDSFRILSDVPESGNGQFHNLVDENNSQPQIFEMPARADLKRLNSRSLSLLLGDDADVLSGKAYDGLVATLEERFALGIGLIHSDDPRGRFDFIFH
jgi:hypothetical protein